MVLEVALLNIRPGQPAAFESALVEVLTIIASMPGYLLPDLARCLEHPH
jgi:heme-degrading monooxygenase HmoA